MNCPETLELLSSYIDGACDTPQTKAVETHLATCAGCRAEHSQLNTLVSMMHALPTEPCPPHVAARLGTVVLSSLGRCADPGRTAGMFKGLLAAAAALVVVYVGGILSRPKDEATDYRLAYLDKERSNFDAITRASPKFFGSAVAKTGAPPGAPAHSDQDASNLIAVENPSEIAQKPAGSEPHTGDVSMESESYAARTKTGDGAGRTGLPPDGAQVVLRENAGEHRDPTKDEGAIAAARRESEEYKKTKGLTRPESVHAKSRGDSTAELSEKKPEPLQQAGVTLRRKSLCARVKDPTATASAIKSALAAKDRTVTDFVEKKGDEASSVKREGAAAFQQDGETSLAQPPSAVAGPAPPTLVVLIPESDISLVKNVLKENGCVSFEIVELESKIVRQPEKRADLGRLAIADDKAEESAQQDAVAPQPQQPGSDSTNGTTTSDSQTVLQKKGLPDSPVNDKAKESAEALSNPQQPPPQMVELRITLTCVEE